MHNVSILRELKLGTGDRIKVYKANMIIPQIAENLTKSDNIRVPDVCPVCGGSTVLRQDEQAQVLFCTNEKCLAKQIKSLTHFVSRNAMDIEGISEATIEKFVDLGYIGSLADIFRLERYKDKIVQMEGFGEKSYENLISSIETARKTTLPRLIYGLGISNIGAANARMICKAYGYDLNRIRHTNAEEMALIDGIGSVIAGTFVAYFQQEKNQKALDDLLKELEVDLPEISDQPQKFGGKVFVITGSVEHFVNRNELKAVIEAQGGKVTGSVSAKTDYLINNDAASSSSKNKKARELGIPVITEEEFLEMLNT